MNNWRYIYLFIYFFFLHLGPTFPPLPLRILCTISLRTPDGHNELNVFSMKLG